MTVNVFNKQILSPPKCGSRFLDEIWKDDREYVDLFDMKENKLTDKIKWLVIRNPMDLLISALHTEFIGGWNREGSSFNEKNLLIDFVKVNSNTHWHRNLFKSLYLFSISLPQPPTIVMLGDLSDFLIKELNIDNVPMFNEKKYNFSNDSIWVSKLELTFYLSKQYPNQWIGIQNLLKTDELFWDKMIGEFPIWNNHTNI